MEGIFCVPVLQIMKWTAALVEVIKKSPAAHRGSRRGLSVHAQVGRYRCKADSDAPQGSEGCMTERIDEVRADFSSRHSRSFWFSTDGTGVNDWRRRGAIFLLL